MLKMEKNTNEINSSARDGKCKYLSSFCQKHLIKYRNDNEKKKNETTITKHDHFNSNFKSILQRTKFAFDRILEKENQKQY